MKIKFWGTRGVVASPGKSTIVYGGNTPCIHIEADNGDMLIIDAGTGIIRYGKEGRETKDRNYHLLLSHTHLDHISGFVFFKPIHYKNCNIIIYSPEGTQKGLFEIFENLFQTQYSPLRSITNVAANISFKQWQDNISYPINSFNVSTAFTDHTTRTLAYRIESEGVSICYVTDHDARESHFNDGILKLIEGCSLLIHDAQFSHEEYLNRHNFGHSSFILACNNAVSANCKKLILFHHDPNHTDSFLQRIEKELAIQFNKIPELMFAREGLEIQVTP